MKIAFDITPLSNANKVRGVGHYTKKLKEELEKQKDIKLITFENGNIPKEADIIHYPYFDLFFRTLPMKAKTPTVVTIHDVIPLVFPNYFPAGLMGYINLFFQKRNLSKTNAIICDSETSKNDITSRLSFSKKSIHVVYLAADSNFREIKNKSSLFKISKKFNLPGQFVLFVGDVNWNKNIANLLEAIKITGLNLVMVGKSITTEITEAQEINKQIGRLGISNRVIKTGFVQDQDLVPIYNLASATVIPSFYEGFGLPVLESMACGTPVVCSNVSSLSEISGNAAVFCDPADPEDISKKILTIINLDLEELEDLKKRSKENAAKYSWEKTAKGTIKVYQSVYGRV